MKFLIVISLIVILGFCNGADVVQDNGVNSLSTGDDGKSISSGAGTLLSHQNGKLKSSSGGASFETGPGFLIRTSGGAQSSEFSSGAASLKVGSDGHGVSESAGVRFAF